jgi:diacylglycerol kinase (ATP)
MNVTKKMTWLFVINPVAGNTGDIDLQHLITDYYNNESIDLHFLETRGKSDSERIAKKLRDIRPDLAVAVGGDGTVNLLASELLNQNIPLGIVPTGSANGMATELGIPNDVEHALDVLAKGKTKTIDQLRINDNHLAIHLCDLGMNARIIRRFDQERIRGFYGYARQFFRELKKPSEFHCTVRCPGQPNVRYKAVMVVLLNTHVYGTGAVINPQGNINDGKFEIVVIKPYQWHYIFRMFVAFFTGNIHKVKHVRVHSCNNTILDLSPEQDLQIDGEHKGKIKTIKADILPASITVVYNQNE